MDLPIAIAAFVVQALHWHKVAAVGSAPGDDGI
jgi:hypothetical protein